MDGNEPLGALGEEKMEKINSFPVKLTRLVRSFFFSPKLNLIDNN
jgi:hypothetical protein